MKSELDRKFFTGGNATFTVENEVAKTHYTFKIRRPRGEDKPLFASLLRGPDNENDYTYLGMVTEEAELVEKTMENGVKAKVSTGRTYLFCRMTKASRLNYNSQPVKVINWILRQVSFGNDLPAGYNVHHEGKCGCCGRTLTVPESIKRGIGPECWSKLMGA